MSIHVMVFAPAPMLTVTIDQTSEEPEIHLHPGGQRVWQAPSWTSSTTSRCPAWLTRTGTTERLAPGG